MPRINWVFCVNGPVLECCMTRIPSDQPVKWNGENVINLSKLVLLKGFKLMEVFNFDLFFFFRRSPKTTKRQNRPVKKWAQFLVSFLLSPTMKLLWAMNHKPYPRVVSFFFVHLYQGKWSNLTNIFRKEWFNHQLHPWSWTWHLKISPWKRRFLLETMIFRWTMLNSRGVDINRTLARGTSSWFWWWFLGWHRSKFFHSAYVVGLWSFGLNGCHTRRVSGILPPTIVWRWYLDHLVDLVCYRKKKYTYIHTYIYIYIYIYKYIFLVASCYIPLLIPQSYYLQYVWIANAGNMHVCILYRSFRSGVIGCPQRCSCWRYWMPLLTVLMFCLPQYKVMVAPETVGYVQIPFFFVLITHWGDLSRVYQGYLFTTGRGP